MKTHQASPKMDTVTGEILSESGSGQSPSQSTRLCQACLFVLAQDNLEVRKNYRHHSTLRAFVEASNMRCYVCSWLLSQVHEDDRSVLVQLAEGIIPHHMIVEEGKTTDTDASDPRAELIDRLRYFNEEESEGVSWVSFTTMRIEAPTDCEGCYKISAYLNPSYEGCFSLDRGVHDTLLKNYWIARSVNRVWSEKLVITSYEGKSILTPIITR